MSIWTSNCLTTVGSLYARSLNSCALQLPYTEVIEMLLLLLMILQTYEVDTANY